MKCAQVFQGMDVDDSRGVTEKEFVKYASTVVAGTATGGAAGGATPGQRRVKELWEGGMRDCKHHVNTT